MALRSQRTNHVLHYEYTSTGENLPFLEEEYEIATENGVFQMNGRWSDKSHSTVEIGQCRWREGDCIVKVLLRTHYPYSGTEEIMETKLVRIGINMMRNRAREGEFLLSITAHHVRTIRKKSYSLTP